MKFLAVIPARGGSKGIPKKNIKLLEKKPLIEYTINDAKNSKLITEIVVSTDNQEIAIAFKPRDDWPKMFKFLRLYKEA